MGFRGFSKNRGSLENGLLYLKGNDPIGDTTIFFYKKYMKKHGYGRKGKLSINCEFS